MVDPDVALLGQGPNQIRVLGRILGADAEGWYLEADPQHLELAARDLGLGCCKGASTPYAQDGSRRSAEDLRKARIFLERRGQELEEETKETPLGETELKLYQSVSARLNFLSLDRPDIQFGVKEAMRRMSTPTSADMESIKRVVRYLMSIPRIRLRAPWNDLPKNLTVFCDSNWAGCQRTRKSTAGGAVLWGVVPQNLGAHTAHIGSQLR